MIQIDLNQILSQLTRMQIVLLVIFLLELLLAFIGIITWLYMTFYAAKFSLYLKKNKSILKKRKYLLEPFSVLKTFDLIVWSKYNIIANAKKKLQYIFNSQDTQDPQVLYYKQKLRPSFKLFVFTWVVFIILWNKDTTHFSV